eukprot:CAMPEP_0182426950 /NCGR_PEP_ID=MMETSP1167-20130531/13471_1 /TAXON_ID=2988 /ORGANISM="Mallomonas Sp, Strain CCMP3275" /LENGTH=485 /DNA_ID=CAMNT_0024608737 /DNA_START=113 /DNA_END=1570 /DNA_ORIENTATION=-
MVVYRAGAEYGDNDDDETMAPTLQPTLSTSSEPTPVPKSSAPTSTWGRIVNGGFEFDANTVESKGAGFYSMLPTGWNDYRAAVMVSYALAPNHMQDNSGDIFLSIFASHNGFILQNVTACAGMTFTLSFSVASYSCNGCDLASVYVDINAKQIFQLDTIDYEWTQLNVTFVAPSSVLAVKFYPHNSGAQLLLDNVQLSREGIDDVTCTPTQAPTTASPTPLPTPKPSGVPTGVPSSFPTGLATMITVYGQFTLESVSNENNFNEVDLTVIEESLASILEATADSYQSLVQISSATSTRINEYDIEVNFNLDVLQGRYIDLDSDKYFKVVNATRDSLRVAMGSGNSFLTKLSAGAKACNGTSSITVSDSSSVKLNFYKIVEVSDVVKQHRNHDHVDSELSSTSEMELPMMVGGGVGCVLLLSLLVAFLRRSQATKSSTDDDEKQLLGLSQGFSQELELSEYVKSSATDFEKVMSSSLHSLIPEQAP